MRKQTGIFFLALTLSHGAVKADDVVVPARSQGVRASLDPASGALVEHAAPTEPDVSAETETETQARTPQDFTKTRIDYLPDGRVHIALNGQLKMAAFARLDSTGRATTWCAPDAQTGAQSSLPHDHPHTAETTR